MPRIRAVKPEFWQSETVAGWHPETRLTFIGLMVQAEDNGVGQANPLLLASALYPLDDRDTAVGRVERALSECAASGSLMLYRHEGKALYFVTGWDAHQRVNRPSRTRFPRPDDATGPVTDPSVTTHGPVSDPPVPGPRPVDDRDHGRDAPTPDVTSANDRVSDPSVTTHGPVTDPSLRAHAGIWGMGDGGRRRGDGARTTRTRPPEPPPNEDAERVVRAWVEGGTVPTSRRDRHAVRVAARELIDDEGADVEELIAAAAECAREGHGAFGLSVQLRKRAAARKPTPSPMDQRLAGWQALKGPGAQVIDAECVELPRAAGGDR